MARTHLRLHAHSRRMMARRVMRLIYKRPFKSEGPAPKTRAEEQIDELLDTLLESFDLSPILSGDSLAARIVAIDLVREVRMRAVDGASSPLTEYTVEQVMDRWRDKLDAQIRSLQSFRHQLASRVSRA